MKKIACRYPATVSFFILLFCIAGLLINGCSKKDQDEKQIAETQPIPSPTYFTVSSSTDPLVSAIAASLQRQDLKGDIQSQLSGHAGWPKWDYAMVATGTTIVAGKGETGREDSVKIALIPFVQENYVQTNAMLMVKISSADTLYRLIYAGQYAEFGFGKAGTGKWNAFNLFHLFTRFDNAIFGYKKFLVKDKRILDGLGVKNQETATVELVSDKAVAARLVRVPYCTDYDVCIKPCAAKPTAARAQACCLEWSTRSFCTEIWIDDGNPVPPPPSGGGSTPFPQPGSGFPSGGSGGGGPTPVSDPCNLNPNGGTSGHLCFVPDGGWQPAGPSGPLAPNYSSYLSTALNLSSAQTEWLAENASEAQTIYEVLEESLADEAAGGLSYLDSYPAYAKTASQMCIAAAMGNCMEGPYNDKFWNTIKVYLPSSQQTVLIDPIFLVYFTTQCIILKAEHPEWGKFRLFVEATRATVHTYLDAAGMVPGIGEFADLANGVLYTIEGDGLNAKLSFAAAIPIVGWTATTAKWAKKLIVAANGSKRTLVWIKKANNIITFGDRGLLRKVLGLASGDKRIAHHIIPWEKASHPAVQKAAQGPNAFHLNEMMNGIPLNLAVHTGNHAAYLNKLQAALDAIPTNLNPQQTRTEVEKIINRIRTAIQNNPNTHIDNLVF